MFIKMGFDFVQTTNIVAEVIMLQRLVKKVWGSSSDRVVTWVGFPILIKNFKQS